MPKFTVYACDSEATAAEAQATFRPVPGQQFPIEADNPVDAVERLNELSNDAGFSVDPEVLKQNLADHNEPYAPLLVVSEEGPAAIVHPHVTEDNQWDIHVAPLFPELAPERV